MCIFIPQELLLLEDSYSVDQLLLAGDSFLHHFREFLLLVHEMSRVFDGVFVGCTPGRSVTIFVVGKKAKETKSTHNRSNMSKLRNPSKPKASKHDLNIVKICQKFLG